MHCPNHLSSQTRPFSVPGLRADSLQLVFAENGGILWHALEHHISMSYSWIPVAKDEGGDHLRSDLIAHLQGVGAEGLGMVRGTWQNVPRMARDLEATGKHSSDENF